MRGEYFAEIPSKTPHIKRKLEEKVISFKRMHEFELAQHWVRFCVLLSRILTSVQADMRSLSRSSDAVAAKINQVFLQARNNTADARNNSRMEG